MRLINWLQAANDDTGLSESGRKEVEAFTLQHARNRLELEDLVRRHREIEFVELEPPIIVTGLPRSGTTALARLIVEGLEDTPRWLPHWEALRPFSGAFSDRRTAARRHCEQLTQAAPVLAKMHDYSPGAIVDDTELQCLAFGSYALEWHAHVPDWRDSYLKEDQRPVYRYLKRAMQALTFLRGPRRWLLKSPQHIEQLPAIADVFPGATIVVTSRPCSQALASMHRLMDAMAIFRRRPIPQTYWRERFAGMVASYEVTKHLFPDRIELELAEWSASPGAVLERLT